MKTEHDSDLRFLIGCAVAGLVLASICFGAGLDGALFGDDFLYLVREAANSPLWGFTQANPLHIYAFRPLEFATIWISQDLSPASPVVLHAFQVSLHLATALLLVCIARGLGFSRTASALAGAFLLVSQSSVHAVMSCDTVSQQFQALFGCASLYLFHLGVSSGDWRSRLRLGGLSVVAFLFALLGKEAGVSLLACFGLYLGYRLLTRDIGVRRAVVVLLPHLLVVAAYMSYRRYLGLPSGEFGERPFDFRIGSNLVVNPILALAQAAMPFSSAEVFLAIKARDLGGLVLPSLGTAIVLAMPVLGFVLSGGWRMGAWITGLFFASISVVFLMNHISELYVYSALPFFALFFAVGVDGLIRKTSGSARLVVYGLVVAVVASNIFASRSKTAMMTDLGERASRLRPQVERIMAEAPPGAKIVLVNPFLEPGYSVFRQEGFVVVSELPHAYKTLRKREDLDVAIVGYSDQGVEPTEGVSYYTYDRDLKLVPYSRKD